MKTAIVILVMGIVLAGCAGGGFVNTKSGKYLQFMNPMNSQVASQVDHQNESACGFDLSTTIRQLQKESPEVSKYLSCNDISFASSLPFRAVVKNKLNNTFDTHFITLELCNNTVDDFIKDQKLEVIVPCHLKQ